MFLAWCAKFTIIVLEKKGLTNLKVEYQTIINIKVIQEVEGFENLKSPSEFANGIVEMICDEAVMCNAVAVCEVMDSTLTAPINDDTDEVINKPVNVFGNLFNKFVKTY